MNIKLIGYLVRQKIGKQWTPGELITACGEAYATDEKALLRAIRLEYPKARLTPQYDRS